MTTKPPGDAEAQPVALLLVHGVGSQERGETLNGLLSGLRLAYADRLEIQRLAEDHAILVNIGREVHIFEVYWANLLRGEIVKSSFDIERFTEVAWFPLLNCRNARLGPHPIPRGRVLRWTTILAPISSLVYAGFWGAKFLASLPTGILHALRERRAKPPAHPRASGFLETVRARRDHPDAGRTILDNLMDQVAGDVINYVHGVGRAFPEDNDQTRQLINNIDEIHDRFLHTAHRAAEQGCAEIQVLAHSLGTVIAFLAMCPQTRVMRSTTRPISLTRFYTIGSPLEKIRFFWPGIIENSANGPAIATQNRIIAADSAHGGTATLKWDNFFNRLDLVSGQLGAFPGWPAPMNKPARGLGGLITAHIAYNRNADFLALLGEGLTGQPSHYRPTLVRRLGLQLLAALETLALPATFLALAVLGLVFMSGIAWLSGWIFSQPFEWIGLHGAAQGLRIYFVAAMAFMMTIGAALNGYLRAKELHARFWVPDRRQ